MKRRSRRSPQGGPLAAPGSYQVKFTVNNKSLVNQFKILIDPRIAADGMTIADFQEQETLCLKIRDLLSDARKTIDKIQKAQKIISEKVQKNAQDELILNQITQIQANFETARGRYRKPQLLDQIGYLNSMVNRTDQKPGRDAYIRYEELKLALQQYKAEFEQVDGQE